MSQIVIDLRGELPPAMPISGQVKDAMVKIILPYADYGKPPVCHAVSRMERELFRAGAARVTIELTFGAPSLLAPRSLPLPKGTSRYEAWLKGWKAARESQGGTGQPNA